MRKLQAVSLRALCASAAFFTTAALAAPVYEQAPTPGPNVGSSWTSHYAPGTGGFRTLDDFALATAANIGRVTWRGIYLSGNLTNGAPSTDTWTVEFWSSAGAAPASAVFSETVSAASVARTSVAGGGLFGANPVDLYDFDLDLGSAFSAAAGTTYWFTVRSNAAGAAFAPFFSWTMAGGNGTAYQHGLDAAGTVNSDFVRQGDRAFALYAVPEPRTMGMVILALALLWGASLRQRLR